MSPSPERPPMNGKRVLLGLVGLIVGFVLLVVGLNKMGEDPGPPPTIPLPAGSSTAPPGTR